MGRETRANTVNKEEEQQMKTLIAIPCMDMVHTAFLNSLLKMHADPTCVFAITQATLIYDARNRLYERAMEDGCDYIMFLDSDMTFEPDILERLTADMLLGYEFVTGIYFKRKNPITPTIYSRVDYVTKDGMIWPEADAMMEYPKDQVFEIAACGFGGCMMKTDLIHRVRERFGPPFSPMIGFGEDLSFCKRATEIGAKLFCDSKIKLGHVMQSVMTEEVYEAGHIQK